MTDVRQLPPAAVEMLRQAQQELAAPSVSAPPPIDSRLTPDELDRRVRAYIARVGTVGEGQRNATSFLVSAWLLNDMALEIEQAWPYVVEWNAGNAPPLDEAELRNAFKSALKHGRRARGSGLSRARPLARPVQRSRFSIGAWSRTLADARSAP